VKRRSGLILPLLLALAGGVLIVVGQLDLGGPPTSSLPPLFTPTPVAVVSPTPEPSLSPGQTAAPTPIPTPVPADWIAVQLQVPAVGVNVRVESRAADQDELGQCCAFIATWASWPGHGGNAYIAAHAQPWLFKGLWNAILGDEVQVLMSDGQVLVYRITEIHPNVSCPDANAEPMPDPPLDLLYDDDCREGRTWTQQTNHERLTLQTSQGYNRNWGELVIIALPVGG
jgi:hypothetical protein